MAYATVQELTGHLGYAPNGGQRLLDRASRDIAQALLCSIYDVDGTGAATDAKVVTALKDATLEQVAYQLEIGNVSGIAHGMQSGVPSGASAGSVDLSRGQSVGGNSSGLPKLGDQAELILRMARLLPAGPRPV